METTVETVVSSATFPATPAQINLMRTLGIPAQDGITRGEASRLITTFQTAVAMREPSSAQLAKRDGIGAKALAGAKAREVQNQIAICEAYLTALQTGSAASLMAVISERLMKPAKAAPVPVQKAEPEDDGSF